MSISEPVDTIATCTRNSISDVTFYDTANIVNRTDLSCLASFPFRYIENNRISSAKSRDALMMHLKDGRELPVKPFHDDWIIVIVLFAGFIYSLIRTFSKSLFPEFARFFLFRGAGETTAREIGEIFHWQSALVNLITFFNLALFAYCAAFYYDIVPEGISGFLCWLIALGIIIAAVTIRHVICIAAGNLSGERDAFGEYIIAIYLTYRYMAIVLFILVVLLAYSIVLPSSTLLLAGFITIGALYLIRISRLALIFIKRNISILYLILYLCALEFLPVLIALKYFTGLF